MDAPPTAELPAFRAAVLDWYARNRRPLPFRATSDPYAILVAETMAQQTQIGRVGDAWRRFLERFPTIRDLAGAPLPDVVRAWAGLGYNRRAVLLHRAARRIVDEHGGSVPADLAALERLPGVGPYTGRAIAATAFGLPVGAVDTNVRRLLGRLTGTSPDEPVRGAAGRTGRAARTVGGARAMRPPGRGGRHDRSGDSLDGRALQALADRLVPPDRAADWTHALMDLGSTVCRARPDCPACPVRAWCASAVRRGVERPASGRERTAGPRHARPSEPFEATTRWLRGRLVALLAAARTGEWLELAPPIGRNERGRVLAALSALERDGIVERHPSSPLAARLAGASEDRSER